MFLKFNFWELLLAGETPDEVRTDSLFRCCCQYCFKTLQSNKKKKKKYDDGDDDHGD